MNDEYKSVCDTCGGGNYSESQVKCSRYTTKSKHCGECGMLTYAESKPCPGTLRLVDTSSLAPQFAPYLRDTSARLEVISPDGYKRRGYVGRTTGWKPAYILLPRRNSWGSSDVLSHKDRILKIIKK